MSGQARAGVRWRAIGAFVRGDSHRRSGLPNQDALALVPGQGDRALVAIADGHGSDTSFRSDVGASFAVTTAVRVVRAFAQTVGARSSVDALRKAAAAELPVRIVRGWIDAVSADLSDRPFMDWELERLRASTHPDAVADLRTNPLIAYGATLLVAADLDPFLMMLQLGDGDIVAISSGDPPPIAKPVPADARLVGNETTSLCLPKAEADFRLSVIDMTKEAPELLLLTTDGYANSFVDEGAFLQAGPDILGHIRERGLDWVGEQLPSWLEEASRHGSGDDITMGILCRDVQTERRPSETFLTAKTISADDEEKAPTPTRQRGAIPTTALSILALLAGVLLGAALFRSSSPLPAALPSGSTGPGPETTTPPPADQGQWIWNGRGHLVELIGGQAKGDKIPVPGLRDTQVTDVIYAFGYVWVAADRRVVRVDLSGETKKVPLEDAPTALSMGPQVVIVWADGSEVSEIAPTSLEVTLVGASSSGKGTTAGSSSA